MQNKFEKRFLDEYFLVTSFFDFRLRRDDFKSTLKNLAEGRGLGGDQGGITFPGEFDEEYEGDKDPSEDYFTDGVMIFVQDMEIIIDNHMYVKCVELACEIYMEEHGEDEEVKRDLQIIKDRYADK